MFDTIEGMRHQVKATDTVPHGSIHYLEARHRGHARVEDRIDAARTPASADSARITRAARQTPATHRRTLALGNRPRGRVRPVPRATPTSQADARLKNDD